MAFQMLDMPRPEIRPSERSNVSPFHAMDVLARANALAAEGRDIVSLAVGQPSAKAPKLVRDAAAAAVQDGSLGYTDALGRRDLREAITAHYEEHYGLSVSPGHIAVTTGSSAGFALSFLAMFDVGDRVVIERPGYPAYRNIMGAMGLEVVEVEQLDAESLEALHRRCPVRGMLVASPGNPTGAVIPPGTLKVLLETARDLGIAAISDEIYHRLTYDGVTDRTAIEFDDDAVVINSFSKYYCMTGWRIGWMVLPERLIRPIERIAQSLYICAPEASQIGAIEAFKAGDELERAREGYALNRGRLIEALPKMGFRFAAPPDGAFYTWLDASELTEDSMSFAYRMLEEAGVAATPGHDFDPVHGPTTMRFSYAGAPRDIEEAIGRLEGWLR